MAASTSASVAAVKVLTVSPVAGLIVAMGTVRSFASLCPGRWKSQHLACHYRSKREAADEHTIGADRQVPGKRGGFRRLRDSRRGEHPLHAGAGLLGHPVC